jgi:hypothetical protein
MKKVFALCLMIGLMWAFPRTDVNIIDDGVTDLNVPHHVLLSRQGAELVDSSGNVYTSWTNRMECLSYSPTAGGLEFINRGYSPTGVLNAHQTDASFSFWVHDYAAYNEDYGAARYPSSLASDGGPHLGYPILDQTSGTWGHMGGSYESGGWWSSFWDAPVDLTGDIGSPRSVPKELPNGDIVFISDQGPPHYETWSSDLSTQRSEGDFGTADWDYIGVDCNGGICYLFLLDDALQVQWCSTTDGITWNGPNVWNLTWPTPYTNNLIDFYQMAVTDAGNPIMVFNIADNDDAIYPYSSKTYVSTASGAAPIQVSDDTYECSWWPTIATGGDFAVVFMHVWTNAEIDSFARMDHFAAFSPDNGQTWTQRVNLTAAEPNMPGLGQIAKRINTTDGRIYFYYGVSLTVPDQDPDYWMYVQAAGPAAEPAAWYVCWDNLVGIAENNTDIPTRTTLNFAPNPVARHSTVSYALSKAGEVSLKIFDLAGREVQTVARGYKDAGVYSANVDMGKLANGTYFFVLDSPAGKVSRSLVVVH